MSLEVPEQTLLEVTQPELHSQLSPSRQDLAELVYPQVDEAWNDHRKTVFYKFMRRLDNFSPSSNYESLGFIVWGQGVNLPKITKKCVRIALDLPITVDETEEQASMMQGLIEYTNYAHPKYSLKELDREVYTDDNGKHYPFYAFKAEDRSKYLIASSPSPLRDGWAGRVVSNPIAAPLQ